MKSEVSALVRQMRTRQTYDEAWLIGLEIQSLTDHKTAIAIFESAIRECTEHVRRAAAFWLTDDAEHVPPELLLEMANDADAEVRFHAAYCLGYAAHTAAVSTLRRLLREDRSEDVRQTAAQSIYAASQLNGYPHAPILDDFASALRTDGSRKVREEVAISLANFLKSPEVQRAQVLLETALEDEADIVREQASISLSVLRDEVWHHDDPVLHPGEL
jgi:HEAT repeat protein